MSKVQEIFRKSAIYGNEERRKEAWVDTKASLERSITQYRKDNESRLQQALIGFAPLAFLGAVLFVADRASDLTCDWWSHTCTQFSRVVLLAYLGIFIYIGVFGYILYSKQGKVALGMALAELGKEMIRLFRVYSECLEKMQVKVLVMKLPAIIKKVFSEKKSLKVALEETGVMQRAHAD